MWQNSTSSYKIQYLFQDLQLFGCMERKHYSLRPPVQIHQVASCTCEQQRHTSNLSRLSYPSLLILPSPLSQLPEFAFTHIFFCTLSSLPLDVVLKGGFSRLLKVSDRRSISWALLLKRALGHLGTVMPANDDDENGDLNDDDARVFPEQCCSLCVRNI